MILAAVVVVALLAVGAWFYRRKQSHTLQEHFGPEYDRTVTELGSRAKGGIGTQGAREARRAARAYTTGRA